MLRKKGKSKSSVDGFIFLSYSTKDKSFAGALKEGLTPYGFEVFLAHEDLVPAEEWQQEIRKALRRCDVFVPVLTKNFHASEWTDQEVGFALGRGPDCVIVPLVFKPVKSPHGFLSQKQALKVNKDDLERGCRSLIKIIDDKIGVSEGRKDRAIREFSGSGTFADAKRNVKALLTLGNLSRRQMDKILTAAITNRQIYEAFNVPESLNRLVARHECSIELRDRFLKLYHR